MTDREKLIDLLDEVHHVNMGKEYRERLGTIADHLLSHGVTIVEDHTGEKVFALFDVSKYLLKSGKVKERATQIYTFRHLRNALRSSSVEIREKICTKTDMNKFVKMVFKTREEAETAVMNCRKEQK